MRRNGHDGKRRASSRDFRNRTREEVSEIGPRGEVARADLFCEEGNLTQRHRDHREKEERICFSAREREDEEAAFAGNDDGEEAAVGRDGEVSKGDAVENGNGLRLGNGSFLARCGGDEGREVDPDEIARLFLDGAFQENAGFVGGPVKDA